MKGKCKIAPLRPVNYLNYLDTLFGVSSGWWVKGPPLLSLREACRAKKELIWVEKLRGYRRLLSHGW